MSDPELRAAQEVLAGQPGSLARRWLGGVALACLALFSVDTVLVATRPLLGFDVPVEIFVQHLNWGPLAYLMELTNWIAGYKQTLLGLAVVGLLFAIERRAGFLMLLGSLGSLLDQAVKAGFARHRPTANLVHILDPATGYSYPSGHAVFYTWLAFMLAAALAPRLTVRGRIVAWAVAGFLVLMACLGRIWAGAHWPSDVLGGFLLGLGWSAFVLWVPERWLPEPSWTWF